MPQVGGYMPEECGYLPAECGYMTQPNQWPLRKHSAPTPLGPKDKKNNNKNSGHCVSSAHCALTKILHPKKKQVPSFPMHCAVFLGSRE